VAIVGLQEDWGEAFVRSAYKHWFQKGQETGSEQNLSNSLDQDPKRVLKRADSDEIARIFDAETDAARELGIFGSPTFVVGRELFCGDDRLEDAISFHQHGRLTGGSANTGDPP
jgi:2-hydroxychromene-2-carboxylate isomerase